MSKYELSLAQNYVPDWGIVEAVREFFQNAIDQQAVNPDNAWCYTYSSEIETLEIKNKNSVLEAKTLLLGNTSKADDPRTIGSWGEGYKVATLVALRCGKEVTFYNYGKKEVWKPRFVNSRKYGVPILVFETEKFIWKKPPNNNLTIEIKGITEDEWEQIRMKNLHTAINPKCHNTAMGRILLDEQYKGQIFLGGLYVCTLGNLQSGYDLPVGSIELDRDRRMVSSFDVQWYTSKMWTLVEDIEAQVNIMKSNAEDVRYIANQGYSARVPAEVSNKLYEDFVQEYGDRAIPVTSNEDMTEVKLQYENAEPVIVSETQKVTITSAAQYKIKATPRKPKKSTEELLVEWLQKVQDKLTEEECKEFLDIIAVPYEEVI